MPGNGHRAGQPMYPTVADGRDDFGRLVASIRTRAPNRHNTVPRVIAQGDLVLLHTRSQNKPGPNVALTDISG